MTDKEEFEKEEYYKKFKFSVVEGYWTVKRITCSPDIICSPNTIVNQIWKGE